MDLIVKETVLRDLMLKTGMLEWQYALLLRYFCVQRGCPDTQTAEKFIRIIHQRGSIQRASKHVPQIIADHTERKLKRFLDEHPWWNPNTTDTKDTQNLVSLYTALQDLYDRPVAKHLCCSPGCNNHCLITLSAYLAFQAKDPETLSEISPLILCDTCLCLQASTDLLSLPDSETYLEENSL